MANEIFKHDGNARVTGGGVTNDSDTDIVQFRMDATSKRLLTEALIQQDGYDSVGTGTKTVASTGTRVQMANAECKRVIIQAHESNTGTIVVGGASVVAALATRQGFALYPAQSAVFYVSNTNLLYLDATADSQKVNYYYES